MDKNKIERRKEISDFANKLRELVEAAPDNYARRDLRRMVHSLRQRYALTPEQKQARVLDLLADGITTYGDLLSESRFSNRQLNRTLEELHLNKKIRVEKISRNSGAGRPQLCYFPVDELIISRK